MNTRTISPSIPVRSRINNSESKIEMPQPPAGAAWAAKVLWERAFALCLLLVLSPLLLGIAAAVKLESKGPALFRQPRFGRDRHRFEVLKFRTMHSDMADETGGRQTEDLDPRITRVGMFLRRTSLDELPQLLNVLRGDMNIIGPRAHPCGMRVEGVLCADLVPQYHMRHAITPGITGWAQVNGSRGAVKAKDSLEHRVEMDVDYIRNWSIGLDLVILLRTALVLVHRGRGV